MNNSNKIFIVGAGYVGIANGVMLASNNLVHFIDIDREGRMLLERSNGRSMTISAGDVLFE